jgi:hypothetical protein
MYPSHLRPFAQLQHICKPDNRQSNLKGFLLLPCMAMLCIP